jgi:hypothetical protein
MRIKRCLVVSVGFLLGLTVVTNGQSSNGIVICAASDVSEGMVKDVSVYVSANLRVPVTVEPLPTSIDKSCTNLLNYLQRRSGGGCVLGITVNPNDCGFSGCAGRVGFMSISRLVPPSSATNSSAIFERRTRTLAMCMIGRCLSLKPCILPFCSMAPSLDEKSFDLKAPNFCPFCQDKVEKALADLGMKIGPRVRRSGALPKPAPSP